jgi:hypothetical protein
MLKKSLFAVAVVTLLAAMAPAGEIKLHDWPTSYIPQELTDIPVLIDVGFWCWVKDQDKLKIKMSQTSVASDAANGGEGKHNYEGCTTVYVESNFDLVMSSSFSVTPPNDSKWVKIDGGDTATMSAGNHTFNVCAYVNGMKLGGLVGGAKDVQIGTVTLKVAPQ